MSNKCESAISLVDNLYAFLGWVVSYSDYGKEIAVDTVLKRFKLLEKIDESMAFENKKEYDEYTNMLEMCISNTMIDGELDVKLDEDEMKRCEELVDEFTLRFKRAKEFTSEQLSEYKTKKVLGKQGNVKITEPIQPIKMIDHEYKKVVCVFYSPEYAARVLCANAKRIGEVVEKRSFYKGYLWAPCDIEVYKKYENSLKGIKCRKKSKKYL